METDKELLWWQKDIFYNLYVRSFKDSDGDGIGDLGGVIEKLDYLRDTLGIDVLWLSGILKGPWNEYGFDADDFTDVHPAFGGLAAFDDLLRQAHERGMKVLIDFIPNHSSDQHPWFVESRSSRDNPKRDWYVWADPRADGSPPNNWLSVFGGSSWEWDEATGQYYLHSFLKEQPDLNWRNPEVKADMFDVVRFWLDRGVDGFRVDAAHHILKDALLRDNPPNLNQRTIFDRKIEAESQLHVYDREIAALHDIYREMRQVLDEYGPGQRIMVAEVHPSGWHAWTQYYGPEMDEFHFPFNNGFISAPWDARTFRVLVDSIEACLPARAWPNAHTGNFDEWRVATRYGKQAARTAAVLLFTLRGTPLLYYGEEIGMENLEMDWDNCIDPYGQRVGLCRDPQRSPMQWSAAPHAGFTAPETEATWLPVHPNYAEINAAAQVDDPGSLLNLYRALIQCHQSTPALIVGDYLPVESGSENIYAYLRRTRDDCLLIVLNFADQILVPNLSAVNRSGEVLLSTHPDRAGTANLAALEVHPYEGLIIRVQA